MSLRVAGGGVAPPKLVLEPGPRFRWALLVAVVLFLSAATALWYYIGIHKLHPPDFPFYGTWLQPLFMTVGTLFFLFVLRLTTGKRWRDISADGRFIIVSSIVLFSLMWWFGRSGFFYRNLAQYVPKSAFSPLYGFMYFSFGCFFFRTAVPLLLIKFRFRKKPSDFGYALKGGSDVWWVYFVLAAIVCLIVVFYASTLQQFQAKYPMCRRMIHDFEIPLWQFLVYQGFYGMIFVSGESFWRGYISFGLRRDLGYMGLVFMIIPYTMAHFGKPWPETLGAMLTGMVLGGLALRHRSFWLGVAAHWGVALTMDLSAVWRLGIRITY